MDKHLDVAIDLAKQAGEIMRQNFTIGMKKKWKADSTPLTVTDTTVNAMVINEIAKHFPDEGIVGEEQSAEKQGDYVWVVDPVDGTAPFSHGIPTFVFSLALTHKGNPILGVIYDPIMDRLLHAEKDKGTWLQNKRMTVSTMSSFRQSMVNLDTDTIPLLRKSLTDQAAWCYTFNSAVYGGMMVALGEFVAEVYAYNKPWDGAAMKIIVEEAGGKVTDLNGNEQRYDKTINGCVATNGKIHSSLIDLIKKDSSINPNR